MALSVAELLFVGTPLPHRGPSFGFDALPSQAPREGAREPASGQPVGQSLHFGTDVATTKAQFGESCACGSLFGTYPVLFDDA